MSIADMMRNQSPSLLQDASPVVSNLEALRRSSAWEGIDGLWESAAAAATNQLLAGALAA